MSREQSQAVATFTLHSPVNRADYKGQLCSAAPDPTHGMMRYKFTDGKAYDFTCFCGAVFADTTQLSVHAFNAA